MSKCGTAQLMKQDETSLLSQKCFDLYKTLDRLCFLVLEPMAGSAISGTPAMTLTEEPIATIPLLVDFFFFFLNLQGYTASTMGKEISRIILLKN